MCYVKSQTIHSSANVRSHKPRLLYLRSHNPRLPYLRSFISPASHIYVLISPASHIYVLKSSASYIYVIKPRLSYLRSDKPRLPYFIYLRPHKAIFTSSQVFVPAVLTGEKHDDFSLNPAFKLVQFASSDYSRYLQSSMNVRCYLV